MGSVFSSTTPSVYLSFSIFLFPSLSPLQRSILPFSRSFSFSLRTSMCIYLLETLTVFARRKEQLRRGILRQLMASGEQVDFIWSVAIKSGRNKRDVRSRIFIDLSKNDTWVGFSGVLIGIQINPENRFSLVYTVYVRHVAALNRFGNCTPLFF